MLTALAEGALPGEVDVKQLCARIDLQIRRLLEGSKNVAERLMRDALYYVAQADSGSELVRQVKGTYQLDNAIPAANTQISAPQRRNAGACARTSSRPKRHGTSSAAVRHRRCTHLPRQALALHRR